MPRAGASPLLDRPSRIVLAGSLCLAVVVLLVLIFTHQWISAARLLKDDGLFRSAAGPSTEESASSDDLSGTLYHLPDSVHVRRCFLSFELPRWNRHQGGGFSPLIQMQGAVLSPLRWPLLLVPERHVEDARLLLALALALAGTFGLLRSMTCSVSAALLAGLAYAFSADFIGSASPVGMSAHALLPWLVLAARAFHAWPSPGRLVLLVSLVMLTLTSGHPVLAAAVLGTAALILVADHVATRGRWRELAWSGAAAGLGVALSAWALLPFAAALADHWIYKFDTPTRPSPVRLHEWFETMKAIVRHAPGDVAAERLVSLVYLGPATVVLALLGLWVARRHVQWRFLFATLTVSLLLCVPGPWLNVLPP